MTTTMYAIRCSVVLSLVALPGCFSLAREEPAQQHFVLGAHTLALDAATDEASPGEGVPSERLSGLRIGLRRPRMAEYLDSPLIVVRRGAHEIQYSEFNRWAGDLETGVLRTLEKYLTEHAGLGGVDTAPWDSRRRHDFLVQVHVLKMEGLAPGDRSAGKGAARMRAAWEIINPADGAVLLRGVTDHETSGWVIGDFDDLVVRLDAGIWKLSRDLVSALGTL